MSIAGYLASRNNTELRMPKSGEPSSNRGENTIRYEGPVLTGEKSVEQEQRDDMIRPASHLHNKVGDRDPMLREYPPAIAGKSVLPLEPKPRMSGPGIIWKSKK
jgi:hypothetical protein